VGPDVGPEAHASKNTHENSILSGFVAEAVSAATHSTLFFYLNKNQAIQMACAACLSAMFPKIPVLSYV